MDSVQQLEDFSNLLIQKIDILTNRISIVESENKALQDRLYTIEERKRKKTKKDLEKEMQFKDYKEIFLRSEPSNRTDPMTNEELALYLVYCKMQKNKKDLERITSWEDLYKRSRGGIQNIINYFTEMCKNNNVELERMEQVIRNMAKSYIEYVIFTHYDNKKWEVNHYTITSDWALNTFGGKTASWNVINKIKDEELKETEL